MAAAKGLGWGFRTGEPAMRRIASLAIALLAAMPALAADAPPPVRHPELDAIDAAV